MMHGVYGLFRLGKRGSSIVEVYHQGFKTIEESAREETISNILLILPTPSRSLIW